VWPVSFAKSTLQASTSGAANVAPLPFTAPANAGELDSNTNEAVIAARATFLRFFIDSSPLNGWN
jgi:hypothetical protein